MNELLDLTVTSLDEWLPRQVQPCLERFQHDPEAEGGEFYGFREALQAAPDEFSHV